MVGTAVIVAMSNRGSPDWVGPGLIGLLVILGLLVAVFFLWRSMNKQLKRVHFDDSEDSNDQRDQRDRRDGPSASTASGG